MTVPAQVLAAVRSIPHPRQEPTMTAPLYPLEDHADAELGKLAEFDAAEEPEEVTVEKLRTTIAVLRGELATSIRANGVWRAKLEAVEALTKAWEDDTRDWYYENRYTHENGINYVAGYEDGWNHADELLRAALRGDRAPLAGQHTTDEEA